jgi:type VI secretion system protein ImpA
MSEYLDVDLESLLEPLPGDDPCGEPLVFDPAFTEIRLAREEDDPSLSMRHWERPLKFADWAWIENRCRDLLSKKGKDLQVAAWLLEAWVRRHHLEGLSQGLKLITALLRRYPVGLHPRVDDDGDFEARIAPFEWLAEYMPRMLKLHVPLVVISDSNPSQITMAVWEKITAQDLATKPNPHQAPQVPAPELTRAMVVAYAHEKEGPRVLSLQSVNDDCLRTLDELKTVLDEMMGQEAPTIRKIRDVLAQMGRVLGQLAPAKPKQAPVKAIQMEVAMKDEPMAEAAASRDTRSANPARDAPHEAVVMTAGWSSREEAYQTLEALADYLSQTEPHSPTPYLIRRAVNWGRMSLRQLMDEIVREEGDLNRLPTVLGLSRQNLD